MRFISAIVLVTAACGTSSPKTAPAPQAIDAAHAAPSDGATAHGAAKNSSEPPSCERTPFERSAPIAEASGATWMPDGTLLVVGDSGTNGAYLTLDSTTGVVLRSGAMPLDTGASDDLEGLSRIGETLYGITSSGYMREWTIGEKGYSLSQTSYAIAGKRDRQSVCESPMDSNCGPNYEGLCLHPSPKRDAPCVGFAAAKAWGELVCLTQTSKGRLVARPEHRIKVAAPKTLSGCHFAPDGALWFGNNVFAANAVGYVRGYDEPKSATITRLGPLGLGFSEAIAVGPEMQVYRFSDTARAPSLLDAYQCR